MKYKLIAYENGIEFGKAEINANVIVINSNAEYFAALKLVAELTQSKGDFTDMTISVEQETIKIENVTDMYVQALIEETTRKLKISWQPQ